MSAAFTTATNFLLSTVINLNTNTVNLSTGTVGRFSTHSNAITTRSLALSNSASGGYAITSCNAGLRINSDQQGQISIINPSGTVAEILFNTVAVGGVFTAMGSGDATRGSFWFVGGSDKINVGAGGNVSINNNFVVNTAHTLFVNGNLGVTSSITVSGGGLQLTNTATTNSVFNSTNLTVLGSISTTNSIQCVGRFNTPSVANISTLILGNNIVSSSSVSLDIYGSYKTRSQTFFSTGTILVNNGNLLFANISTAATLTLPQLDASLIGLSFWMHKNNGSGQTVTLSTSGSAALGAINDNGNTFTVTQGSKLVSIMCLQGISSNASWHIIDL